MRIGSDYVIPLNIRIIAATNEELKTMVEEGRFRKDLFYRLNILELHIPPLRERKEDILPLFKYFMGDIAKDLSYEVPSAIEEKLLAYRWPGNARELRNIAERYIIFKEIDIDSKEIHKNPSNVENDRICINLREINRYVEEKVIEMLVNQGMTKTEIANILGISRTALWKKIKSE